MNIYINILEPVEEFDEILNESNESIVDSEDLIIDEEKQIIDEDSLDENKPIKLGIWFWGFLEEKPR